MSSSNLGIIEGRFGTQWDATERHQVLTVAGKAGYNFYHYGPKADRHLRREWRSSHPPAEATGLSDFGAECRRLGVRFGIALTPIGSTHPFDADARADLTRKLVQFDEIGIDDLVILFDDLRGDLPDLAARQADVVGFCADRTKADNVYFCPSYYSDDPVLDRAFGTRPDRYLTDLGRRLDPAIQVYWTGEEVNAREYGIAHLERLAEELRRPVCLWDNCAANDGHRSSRFLTLRGVTGRPGVIGDYVSGHAINPATQPLLSCVTLLTLAASYERKSRYSYATATYEAFEALYGASLAALLREDLLLLCDVGLELLGEHRVRLEARYAAIDHPAAREVVRWLNGGYAVTDEEVKTQ